MPKLDRIADALFAVQLQYFVAALTIKAMRIIFLCNFVLGILFLLLRQAGVSQLDYWGFALAGFPIGILLGAWQVYRSFPAKDSLFAVLDGANKTGGVLLAGIETGDSSWQSRLPEKFAIPRISVNYHSLAPLLFLSIVFLILSIVIPVNTDVIDDKRLQLDQLQENALEKIEILEEVGVLTEEEADVLKKTLEKMVEGSDKNNPSRTFEAFDQLAEKLSREAGKESQQMAETVKDLKALEELAEKMENTDADGFEALKNKLQQAMSQTQQNEEKNGKSSDQLTEAGKAINDLTQSASHNKQDLAKAAKELKDYIDQRRQEIQQNSQKLMKAKLIDRKTFEKLLAEGKIKMLKPGEKIEDDSELVVAPANSSDANSDGQQGQSGQGQDDSQGNENAGMMVGQGQTGRDGGSAPMQKDRRTSEHGFKLIDESLPAPSEDFLDDSIVVGIGISAPEALGDDGNSRKVIKNWQQQGELSDKSDIILPKYRNTIKNYFDRNSP